ncbi:MAG: lipocalin-like domain-containing protein [Rubricoccaceae bacterium]
MLAACSDASDAVRASVSVAEAMSGDTTGYARAETVREFVFPDDHGPHPAFKTEWWYVTGNLRATDGSDRRFGIQFTLFRSALSPAASSTERESPWATNQLYMAHVALGDSAAGAFYAEERFARGAAGLAGAVADPLRVWLGPIELAGAGALARDGTALLQLHGEAEGAAYELTATPIKPIIYQGDRGLSPKGEGLGNASYYFAQTRMATTGTVTLPGGEAVPVEGLTWMDREWSTSALAEDQVGWDWFALHLDDGRDLMMYQLRVREGSDSEPFRKSSIISADGVKTELDPTELVMEPLDTWESPDGATYPTSWRLRVPSQDLDLTVSAMMPDQEFDATVRYWEGAVNVSGAATGVGFLEMTGYADAMNASSRPVPL